MGFQTQSDYVLPRLPEGVSVEQDEFNRAVLEVLTRIIRDIGTDFKSADDRLIAGGL